MKSLIVYFLDGTWYGEDVTWKRSGSGTYREVARVEVPQSRAEIKKFAAARSFVIEWRGEFPDERQSA